MPEARRATTGDFTGGFWIRRAAYPAAMPGSRRRRIQSLVAAIDDKENIHPSRAATARRRPRNRKSPLPSWYPRTPLRDITIIVNALERRMRERAARARQRNANPEASPVTDPAVDEMNASEHTPVGEALPSDVFSDASPSPAASSTLSSLTPTQQPLRTPSSSETPLSTTERVLADPSTEDPKPTEFEKKLQSTISEMERLVLDNLKRAPKPPARKAMRTLMSMR
ncbi:protein POLYCHOME-like [Musa acuminata AAA Group]|uniref:protein POLYCHOME-like n=1 Tax=Musa acuminata AAA Group TaxID=214697 RepID=UPI0031D2E4A8